MFQILLSFIFMWAGFSSAIVNVNLDKHWNLWKKKHGKSYSRQIEELGRRRIWENNLELINVHNLETSLGLHSFDMGINHYGDLTMEEMGNLTGLKVPADLERGPFKLNVLNVSLPSSVDWRKKSLVTEVKTQGLSNAFLLGDVILLSGMFHSAALNISIFMETKPDQVTGQICGEATPLSQNACFSRFASADDGDNEESGSCGSCWAFSAVGALEGQLKKSTGVLMSLSTQNLLDCSNKYGNRGCEGGFMSFAFRYVMKNQGIAADNSYPYHGKRSHCKYNPDFRAANCTGYTFLPKGDEHALKVAVATIGPISVAIDASRPKFVFYKKGVYNDKSCSHSVNHGMLVVGYGTEDGQDYWLLKNSWGTGYGEDGYIKMARNKKNLCGITLYACFPVM